LEDLFDEPMVSGTTDVAEQSDDDGGIFVDGNGPSATSAAPAPPQQSHVVDVLTCDICGRSSKDPIKFVFVSYGLNLRRFPFHLRPISEFLFCSGLRPSAK
jgi:hypothetical protein